MSVRCADSTCVVTRFSFFVVVFFVCADAHAAIVDCGADVACAVRYASVHGMALRDASPQQRDNPDIVTAAVGHDDNAFVYASGRLRSDATLLAGLVTTKPDILRHAMLGEMSTAEFRQLIVANHRVLPFLPLRAVHDDTLLLESVRRGVLAGQYGLLEQLPWKLFAHRTDVAIAMVSTRGSALFALPAEHQNNREVMLVAIEQDPQVFGRLPGSQTDREFIVAAIARVPAVWRQVRGPLRDDRALAEAAVRADGRLLLELPPALRRDAGIVAAATPAWKSMCVEEPTLAQCRGPLDDAAHDGFAAALAVELAVKPGADATACSGADVAACVQAVVGRGVVVVSGRWFVHLASESDHAPPALHRTAGVVDDRGLRVLDRRTIDDRLVRGLVVAQPAGSVLISQHGVDEEPEGNDVFGPAGGVGGVWVTHAVPAPTPWVLCADQRVLPLGARGAARVVDNPLTERLEGQITWALPCKALYVVPHAATRAGRFRAFVDRDAGDGGGAFVDDRRVRNFGVVNVVEQGAEPDRRRCTFSTSGSASGKMGARSMTLTSRSGCDVSFAGDINDDGVADLVVDTTGESCTTTTLWLSTRDGWVEGASVSFCC